MRPVTIQFHPVLDLGEGKKPGATTKEGHNREIVYLYLFIETICLFSQ